MPAILVASKMKSGLPKPVHSAAPILHVPTARTIPQPCYLKFGNKVEVTKPSYSSQIPLKSPNGQENAGDGLPPRKSSSVENGFDTQVRKHQRLGRCVGECSYTLNACSRFYEVDSGVSSCGGGYMCVITSACSAGVFSIPHSGYLLPRGDFVISLAWWGWRWGCEGWCCACSCPVLPRVLALPAPGGWWQGGGRDAASGVRSLCRSCRC